MDKEIDLEKKIKELDNIIYKVGQSAQTVHIVISSQHAVIPVIDEEETLILEEVSRSKMLAKQNDPILNEKKINTTPINYVELNQLSEDFAPSELPKVSLVNTSLKKLKIHLFKFETVVKKHITPDAITEDLLNEVTEAQTIFNQIEAVVQQYSDILLTVMNSTTVYGDFVNLEMQSSESCDNCFDLDAELLKKQNAYNKLLKRKEIVENVAQIPNATTIVPGMFKLDLDPLAPRLLKNRDAHIAYLKYTQEQADILRGIVEQAKAKQPLDNALDFACKHAKRIQELLVYVRDTCPNASKPSEKLVAVTPINKVKKVRFYEPLTSSSNIHKQVESSKTPDSNKLVLPSTGLKSSTSVSRSQPTSNTKNDRISHTLSSNMKNKVEAQLRRVNLSSNRKNRVKDPI
ncbi:hypothetical protein Tco_0556082 [Tanacetum coccineum]